MTTQNLLVELFVEELPPKALNKLGTAFSGVLAEQLKAQGLAAADSVVTAFASPRRLAAHVTGVLAQAADKAVQQKLMPVAVGLDAAGNATPALLKKLQALGADVSDPDAAVAPHHLVVGGVERRDALVQRTPQRGRQAEDPAVLVEPHGDQHGTGGGQRVGQRGHLANDRGGGGDAHQAAMAVERAGGLLGRAVVAQACRGRVLPGDGLHAVGRKGGAVVGTPGKGLALVRGDKGLKAQLPIWQACGQAHGLWSGVVGHW